MAELKIAIVVRFQFAGIHSWPLAPQNVEERYLAAPHRHMFYVEAVKPVTHAERDIEIIALKREMAHYCWAYFKGPHTMSCESMAIQLLEEFGLLRCQVLEDNENGAEVTA